MINLHIGLTVFLALIWWIARTHSYWWRRVASLYGGRPRSSLIARKLPESVIVADRPVSGRRSKTSDYRLYGTCRLALHEDGIALDQVPPLNVMCSSLFLPFGAMVLRETSWGLNNDACVMRMQGLEEVDIIVARRVVDWIRERTDASPFGLGV